MATARSMIVFEVDPTKPVPEIMDVIRIITQTIPGNRIHEEAILRGIRDEIEHRLKELEGAKQHA